MIDGGAAIFDLGNAIFDGGDDMYDIGNLMTTSLMADCDTVNDCPLGSLHYRNDFERVSTNCFGAGGHYQMQQFDSMWVFFTTNTHDSPLDFTITGNLGSDDGSGSVSEYVFDAPHDGHTGFVKRECGDAHDPSVNHMIIVDSQGTHAAVARVLARAQVWTMTLSLVLHRVRRFCICYTARRAAPA